MGAQGSVGQGQFAALGLDKLLDRGALLKDLTSGLSSVEGNINAFAAQVAKIKTATNQASFKTAATILDNVKKSLDAVATISQQVSGSVNIDINVDDMRRLGEGINAFLGAVANFDSANFANISKVAKSLSRLRSAVGDNTVYSDMVAMFNSLWRTISQSNISTIARELEDVARVLERIQAVGSATEQVSDGLRALEQAAGRGGAGSGGLPGEIIKTALATTDLDKKITALISKYDELNNVRKQRVEPGVAPQELSMLDAPSGADFAIVARRNLEAAKAYAAEMKRLQSQLQSTSDSARLFNNVQTETGQLFLANASDPQKGKIAKIGTDSDQAVIALGVLNNEMRISIEEHQRFISAIDAADVALKRSRLSIAGAAAAMRDMNALTNERGALLGVSDAIIDSTRKMELFKVITEQMLATVKGRFADAEKEVRNLERAFIATSAALAGTTAGNARDALQDKLKEIQTQLASAKQRIDAEGKVVSVRREEIAALTTITNMQLALNKHVEDYNATMNTKVSGYISKPETISTASSADLKTIEQTVAQLTKMRDLVATMKPKSTLPEGDIERLPQYVKLLEDWDTMLGVLNSDLERFTQIQGSMQQSVQAAVEARRQQIALDDKSVVGNKNSAAILGYLNKVTKEHNFLIADARARQDALNKVDENSILTLEQNRHVMKALTDEVKHYAKQRLNMSVASEREMVVHQQRLAVLVKEGKGSTSLANALRNLIGELEAAQGVYKQQATEFSEMGSSASAAGAQIHTLETTLQNLRNMQGLIGSQAGEINVGGIGASLIRKEGNITDIKALMNAVKGGEKDRLEIIKQINKDIAAQETALNKVRKVQQAIIGSKTMSAEEKNVALAGPIADIKIYEEVRAALKLINDEAKEYNLTLTVQEKIAQSNLEIQKQIALVGSGGAGGGSGNRDVIANAEEERSKLLLLTQARLANYNAAKALAIQASRNASVVTKDAALNEENANALSNATRELNKQLVAVQLLEKKWDSFVPANAEAKAEVDALRDSLGRLTTEGIKVTGALESQKKAVSALKNIYQDAAIQIGQTISMQIRQFSSFTLIYGTMRVAREVMTSMVQESEALGKALVVSRSSINDLDERLKTLGRTMDDLRSTFGKSSTEIGDALFQLGSAGLNMQQSLAAVEPTMNLVVGTGAEANAIAKTMASTFNILSQQSALTGDALTDFTHIADVLAVTFRDNQIEMDEFVQALKFTVPVANQVGVSFEQLSAILGTLHTQGQKAGLAGRQLRTIFFKLAANRKEFEKAFADINIKIDAQAPLDFIDILRQVGNSIKQDQLSVVKLEQILQAFGLRSTGMFITLANSIDLFEQNLGTVQQAADGVASGMADARLAQAAGIFDKTTETLLVFVKTALKPLMAGLEGFARFFLYIADIVGSVNKVFMMFGFGWLEVVAMVIGGAASIVLALVLLKQVVVTLIGAFFGLTGKMKELAAASLEAAAAAVAAAATESSAHLSTAAAVGVEVTSKETLMATDQALLASSGKTVGALGAVKLAGTGLLNALGPLGTALRGLGAGIMAHPFIAAGVAITAATAGVVAYLVHLFDVEKQMDDVTNAMEKYNEVTNRLNLSMREHETEIQQFIKLRSEVIKLNNVIADGAYSYQQRQQALEKLDELQQKALASGQSAAVTITSDGGVGFDPVKMQQHIDMLQAIHKLEADSIRVEQERAAKEAYKESLGVLVGLRQSYEDLAIVQSRLESFDLKAEGAMDNKVVKRVVQEQTRLTELITKQQRSLATAAKGFASLPKYVDAFRQRLTGGLAVLDELIFGTTKLSETFQGIGQVDIRWQLLEDVKEYGIVVGDILDETDRDLNILNSAFENSGGKIVTFVEGLAVQIGSASPELQKSVEQLALSSLAGMYDAINENINPFNAIQLEDFKKELFSLNQIIKKVGITTEGDVLWVFQRLLAINQGINIVLSEEDKKVSALHRGVKGMLAPVENIVEAWRDALGFQVQQRQALEANMRIIEQANKFTYGTKPLLQERLAGIKSEREEIERYYSELDGLDKKWKKVFEAQYQAGLKRKIELPEGVDEDAKKTKDYDRAIQAGKRLLELDKEELKVRHDIRNIDSEHADTMRMLAIEEQRLLGVGDNRLDQLIFEAGIRKDLLRLANNAALREDQRGKFSEKGRQEIEKLSLEDKKRVIAMTKEIRAQNKARFETKSVLFDAIEGERTALGIAKDMTGVYNDFMDTNAEINELMKRHTAIVGKTAKEERARLSIENKLADLNDENLKKAAQYLVHLREMTEQLRVMDDLFRDFLEIQRSALDGINEIVSADMDDLVDGFKQVGEFMSDSNATAFSLKIGTLFGSLSAAAMDTSEQIDLMVDGLKRGTITADDVESKFGSAFGNMARDIVAFEKTIDDLNEKELNLVRQLAGLDMGILSQILGQEDVSVADIERARGALDGLVGHVQAVAKLDPDSARGMFETVAALAQQLGDLSQKTKEDVFIRFNIDTKKFFDAIDAMTRKFKEFVATASEESIELRLGTGDKDVMVNLAKSFTEEVERLMGKMGHFNKGGLIHGYASGGFVGGSGNTDTVPAMLTPGEFVIPKSVVEDIGVENLYKLIQSYSGNVSQLKRGTITFFQYLNNLEDMRSVFGFNEGGMVPGVQYLTSGGPLLPAGSTTRSGGNMDFGGRGLVAASEKVLLTTKATVDVVTGAATQLGVGIVSGVATGLETLMERPDIAALLKLLGSQMADATADGMKDKEATKKKALAKLLEGTPTEVFSKFREKFSDELNKMLDENKTLFERFGAVVAQSFITAFSGGLDGFADAVSGVLDAVLDMAWIPYNEDLVNATKDSMNKVKESYDDGLEGLVKQLRRNEISYFDYLNRLEDMNDKYQQDMVKAQKDAAKNEDDFAIDRVRSIIDAMQTGFRSVVDDFVSSFTSGIIDAMGNAATNSLTDLFGLFKTGADGIGDSLYESLATGVTKLFVGDQFKAREGTGMDFDNSTGKDILEYGRVTMGVLSDITGVALSAGAALLSFGIAVGSLDLGKVVNFFKGSEEFNLPSIVETIGAVVDKIAAELPQIVKVIAAELPGMLGAIIDGLDEIIPVFIEAAETFIDTLIENMPEIIEALKKLVSGIVESAIRTLPKIGELIAQLVGGILDIIVQEVIPKLGQILEGLFDGITNIVFSIVDRLGDIVGSIAAALPDILNSLTNIGPKIISRLIQAIPKIIAGFIKAIPSILKELGDALPELLDALWEEIADFGSLFEDVDWTEVFKGAGVVLWDIVKSLGESIWAIFAKVGDIFRFIIPKGIKDALTEAGTLIWKGITNAFNEIIEKIKAALNFGADAGGVKGAANWVLTAGQGGEQSVKDRGLNAATGGIYGLGKKKGWWHDGGIIGVDRVDGLKPDETFAVLQAGEGVLNRSVMQMLGEDRFRMLNSGVSIDRIGSAPQTDSPLIRAQGIDNSIHTSTTTEIKVEFHGCTFAGSGEPLVDEIEKALVKKYANRDGSLQRIMRNKVDNKTRRPNAN